jgi:hypothetical protein
LHGFLQFKRSLGYGYRRAEFALREFDQFLISYAGKDRNGSLIGLPLLGCPVSQTGSR